VRFFCVTADAAGVYAGILGDDHGSWRGVYALDPGAAGWTRRTTGLAAGAHPFYVATSPARPDVAWLAGGSDAGTPIVYRTTDGAATWRSVLLTSGNQNVATGWSGSGGDRDWSYGEFAFGLAAHPVDPGRAAFTDLGFVHVTSDGGASWRQAYVERGSQNPPGAPTPRGRHYRSAGLENTSCWWLSWLDPRTLWAGFSDIRGARSVDGGVAWGFDYTGHTLNSAYQSVAQPGGAGTLFLATSSVHDLYMSTYLTDARIDGGSGQVRFSNDKGKTWQQLGSLGKPVIGLALDPNQPHRLYASMVHATLGGIYACPDVRPGTGATWTRLAAPPRTQGHAHSVHALRDGTLVCTYSGRRAGNPLNFTSSSGVFVSTDGGANWQDRSHPDMQWWTKDLVIDPHDATQSTWYVGVFSGWGGPANDRGGLFRTTNRGLNWTRLWTNSHVDSCAVDPADRKQMYVTTEHDGLWWTGNLLAAQPVFRRVESFPFRQPVRVFFNPHAPREVWVTSFGGGLRVGRR
jgi:hypothetical protein